MSYAESSGYIIYAKIVTIICTIVCVTIVVYHTIIQCITANPKETTEKKTKILNTILHICIISAALFNIVGCFGYFGITSSSGTIHGSCYATYVAGLLCYATNKTCVYYSYFLRLDVSFGGSTFEINRIFLRILYTLTTIYFIIYIIALPFVDKRDYSWNYEYNVCESG